MTPLEDILHHNPFSSITFIRRRKVVFLLDQIVRFTDLDAVGFAARIAVSQNIAQQVSAALADTASAVTQKAGATTGVETAFEHLKQVIWAQFAILQATLGKGGELVLKIFGRPITDYTEDLAYGNAISRLPGLLRNLDRNPSTASPDAPASALSASATVFPSAGAVYRSSARCHPQADAGRPGRPRVALPFLLAHNPTSELGQYKVVLG